MATTLTTYFYNGANESDVETTWICLNGHCYVTGYMDVAIFYGQYVGADVVPSVQPRNLPPLQNVAFNCQVYRADTNGNPTSKYAAAVLIARQDIFDIDNPRECLGTKFTFQSPCFEDCGPDGRYCFVWSTGQIEMPYGPDMIYINGQSGVSDVWYPCD